MAEFRDPEGDLAQGLMEEALRLIAQDAKSDAEVETKASPYRTLSKKIRYKWRPEDQMILTQIRAAVDSLIMREFNDVLETLDGFYESVRVPVIVNGVTRLDSSGRVVWEVDEKGKPKEDWSLMTGQDIEEALLNLSRTKFILSQTATSLSTEAVFAKHIYNDIWYESYEGMVEGTQKDREARANREGRQEKYAAFFRYVLWVNVDALLKELANIMRLLERIREWRIRSERS